MRTTATLDQIVEEFLSEQDILENSRLTYKRLISKFILWCHANKVDPRAVRLSDLLRYKTYLEGNRALTYVALNLTVIKKWYGWLETKGYYSDISKNLKLPRRYKGFRKYPFKFEDVERMISLINTKSPKGFRDFVIMNLLVRRGLRLVEVCRMNVGDIKSLNNEIIIEIQRKAQREKQDFVVISGSLYDLVKKYLIVFRGDCQDNDPLFVSCSRYNEGERISAKGIGKLVTTYIAKAGLKDENHSAHSLRHSVAVHLLTNGFGIYDVQKLLGHSKTEITEIYTRIAEEKIKMDNKTGRFLDQNFEKFTLKPQKH